MPVRQPEEKDWEFNKRVWQAKNPGHCGLCGLPFKICFHEDQVYMEEMGRIQREGDLQRAVVFKSIHYLRVLDKMTLAAVEALPIPPKEWMINARRAWIKQRDLDRHYWNTLLTDEVV